MLRRDWMISECPLELVSLCKALRNSFERFSLSDKVEFYENKDQFYHR